MRSLSWESAIPSWIVWDMGTIGNLWEPPWSKLYTGPGLAPVSFRNSTPPRLHMCLEGAGRWIDRWIDRSTATSNV